MKQKNIRNFSIIAHIDHGKSTLADRLLEYGNLIDPNVKSEQVLDDMDLEKERGITIKSRAVKLNYEFKGENYILNLIDTPGHVDFSYEVSRSLASCDAAILLVDATQGIEAQTMTTLYSALEADLEIIPVINKIDMRNAQIELVEDEIEDIIGIEKEKIFKISAKERIGIEELLEGIINEIPAPTGDKNAQTEAMIFDSQFNSYRGVVILIRVFNGTLKKGDEIKFVSNGKVFEIEEVGFLGLTYQPGKKLEAGEVGYVMANIKNIEDARVGDTVTLAEDPIEAGIEGFIEPKPMVYSGIFPMENKDYPKLLDALGKLKLNDASLVYEKDTSLALGYGFRCGFLGMLHLEIFQERLNREHDLSIITTTPSVGFMIHTSDGKAEIISNPADMPDVSRIEKIEEPIVKAEIIVPEEYIGNIIKISMDRRGVQLDMQYIDPKRVQIVFDIPLIEIVYDFYDRLKSVSRGYASLDYEFYELRESDIVKVDVLVNKEKVDAMSFFCHRDKAHEWGKNIAEELKDTIPKHLFKIPIQASIGSNVIARSTIGAMRKDVTAKCYGGDITRKKKLLEKQKKGKKKMREFGSVQIPQKAFLAVMKANK